MRYYSSEVLHYSVRRKTNEHRFTRVVRGQTPVSIHLGGRILNDRMILLLRFSMPDENLPDLVVERCVTPVENMFTNHSFFIMNMGIFDQLSNALSALATRSNHCIVILNMSK